MRRGGPVFGISISVSISCRGWSRSIVRVSCSSSTLSIGYLAGRLEVEEATVILVRGVLTEGFGIECLLHQHCRVA